ncbi:putative membrane protein [Streptococcus equi subsp. zooepidemicus]|uniref:Putative membrane protein n=1 Tax=Streptococcus equi subsp. zooepidemicus (strain H70) TaxID=553483 RepID=C0MDU2_STRS7|nr:putative membrane protein [Streptococcus equi subsp. zooepidemicus]
MRPLGISRASFLVYTRYEIPSSRIARQIGFLVFGIFGLLILHIRLISRFCSESHRFAIPPYPHYLIVVSIGVLLGSPLADVPRGLSS